MASKEYKYKINGNTYTVAIGEVDGNEVKVKVNGTPYKVELASAPAVKVQAPKASAAPRTASGEKIIAARPTNTAGGQAVKAPLPGVVLSIPVKVGDTVKSSDTVVLLEAMKMENAIHAGYDGRVSAINVSEGDSVLEGAVLLTIEA